MGRFYSNHTHDINYIQAIIRCKLVIVLAYSQCTILILMGDVIE